MGSYKSYHSDSGGEKPDQKSGPAINFDHRDSAGEIVDEVN